MAAVAAALEARLARRRLAVRLPVADAARTACMAETVRHLSGRESPLPWAEPCAELLRSHPDLLDRLHGLAAASGPLCELGGFYEQFLACCDAGQRTGRGVYCTPGPLARFVARAVDGILSDDLGIRGGLSGLGDALVLDPAAGPGVFLKAVLAETADPASLGRGLAGIDIDPAALVVCGAMLEEAGLSTARLIVGDALADPERCPHRLRAVRDDAAVAVVIGNPPYLGRSRNRGRWIAGLLRGHDEIASATTASYLSCDGSPLGERNTKWLNDDYVKFLRFAQWRIERTGWGVVGFVVNHGFLSGETFRGMRESLVAAFDAIYVLDLHGNANRRERAPDGGRDENLFPIRQGIAVVLLARCSGGHARNAIVRHADLWGRGEDKGAWLASHDIGSVAWTKVRPASPFHFLAPAALDGGYGAGVPLDDIFPVRSLGIATARDRLAVQFTAAEMAATAEAFAKLDADAARAAFAIGPDGADWRVADAQADLRVHPEAMPVPILYRPFDLRWTIYTGRSRGFLCRPRRRVMDHLVDGRSPALLFGRGIETPGTWSHVFATRALAQLHTVAVKEVNQVAPLWLATDGAPAANLAPSWVAAVAAATGLAWGRDLAAEDVFGYIYAVLHAPSFRERYQASLRHGYPRVPVPAAAEMFLVLARLGRQLLAAHLDPAEAPALGRYEGPSMPQVTGATFIGGRVDFAEDACFSGIQEGVWQHRIGGYQVCRRWLLDRRGRILTAADRDCYRHIVGAISVTRALCQQIDRSLLAG